MKENGSHLLDNKNIFKEMYNKKINKDDNFQKILDKIENKNKIGYGKYILVPISLFIIMVVLGFSAKDNFLVDKNKNLIRDESGFKDKIEINDMSDEKAFFRTDKEIINDTDFKIPNYDVLKDLTVPDYFLKEENYVSSKNNDDKLKYFVKYYKFKDKKIEIKYSENEILVHDNTFLGGSISTINGFDLVIYKCKELLMTAFKYDDLYINIESTNITEDEFVSLVKSIIKLK